MEDEEEEEEEDEGKLERAVTMQDRYDSIAASFKPRFNCMHKQPRPIDRRSWSSIAREMRTRSGELAAFAITAVVLLAVELGVAVLDVAVPEVGLFVGMSKTAWLEEPLWMPNPSTST